RARQHRDLVGGDRAVVRRIGARAVAVERGAIIEEVSADNGGGRRVALAIDAEEAAVLFVALPGDDEPAGVVRGDRRIHLVARGRGVDAELAAERGSRRVVRTAVDAEQV